MRGLSIAFAGLVVAAVCATATAAPAPNGLIAYHEFDQNGNPQIWVVAADGTGQTQITTTDGEAPNWSSDGQRIYFDSDRLDYHGHVHIFSMKPDGSDVQQVTNSDGFDGFPAVSPDGTKLAYDFSNDEVPGVQGIWLAAIDGSGAHQITHSPIPRAHEFDYDSNPDFGPNGWIAFQRVRGNCPPDRCNRKGAVAFQSSIWIVREDGTGLRRLVSGGKIWGDPGWSPDGTKVVLHTYDEGRGRASSADIYVMNADGTKLHPLTHTGKDEVSYTPEWSPDGTKIVFHHISFSDDHAEIWQMNPDGSNQQKIASCSELTFCDFANWGRRP